MKTTSTTAVVRKYIVTGHLSIKGKQVPFACRIWASSGADARRATIIKYQPIASSVQIVDTGVEA